MVRVGSISSIAKASNFFMYFDLIPGCAQPLVKLLVFTVEGPTPNEIVQKIPVVTLGDDQIKKGEGSVDSRLPLPSDAFPSLRPLYSSGPP